MRKEFKPCSWYYNLCNVIPQDINKIIFSINHFSFSPCISTYIIITHWLIINKLIKQQVIANILQKYLIRVLLYKEFYLIPLCFISLQCINPSTIAYNWITDKELSLNIIKNILIVNICCRCDVFLEMKVYYPISNFPSYTFCLRF